MINTEIYEELYGKFGDKDIALDRVRNVLSRITGRRFERFLDIGCGDGSLTLLLARTVQARIVKAIEVSEKAAAEAGKKGIECVKTDIDRGALPFQGESFDLIFCGETIEHVFDTDRLVEYIVSVLAPGGVLLITTPNLASWHGRLSLLLGYNPFNCSVSMKHHAAGKLGGISSAGGNEHVRYFTLRSLEDLLTGQGLIVKKRFGSRAITRTSVFPVDTIEFALSRVPSLATNIGVECVKP